MQTVPLDVTDLVRNGRTLTDPAEAVRRLTETKGTLLGVLAQQGDADLVFHGLAHVPLAVLIGHLVSDRRPVRLFDFHPEAGSGTWSWPATDDEAFPELRVEGLPDRQPERQGTTVLEISVSYPVAPEQTAMVEPNPVLSADLSVPEPARGNHPQQDQTRTYWRAVRVWTPSPGIPASSASTSSTPARCRWRSTWGSRSRRTSTRR